jgi:hypothetical protein
MRRPKPQRNDRAPAVPAERTRDPGQLQRWAELIADGREQFPTSLPPPDRDRLLAAVRRRRRDRLVQHIARAIALDLRGATPVR